MTYLHLPFYFSVKGYNSHSFALQMILQQSLVFIASMPGCDGIMTPEWTRYFSPVSWHVTMMRTEIKAVAA